MVVEMRAAIISAANSQTEGIACRDIDTADLTAVTTFGSRHEGVRRASEQQIHLDKRQTAMSQPAKPRPILTPEQQFLNDLWEEHIRDEFQAHDADATIDTMVADAYVNHVPVMTGGTGREALRDFYVGRFIPSRPTDTQIIPGPRTIGTE